MSWHYQPVYVEEPGDESSRIYSLCEVYLDASGKLESWTRCQIDPIGTDDLDDLKSTLSLMLADTHKYAPIEFGSMKKGMKLERK